MIGTRRAFLVLDNPGFGVARNVVTGGLAACTVLSACTLLDEPLEPELVSDPSAAGAAGSGDMVDAPLSDDATPFSCAAAGVEGSAVSGADPRCDQGLALDPRLLAGGDAGAAPPSLSLPPCRGEFGPFQAPERIRGLGFDDDVFGPSLSSDGRTLYFSGYVAGEQQIYSATRSRRGRDFSNVTELSAVGSPALDGTPFVTRRGEHLYFFSERQGGVGDRDIWVSQRRDGEFGPAELVRNVNSAQLDQLPWLSADELTLIFVSNRAGGSGGADLWRASRASVDAEFDDPIHLAGSSTDQNEGRLALSADGLTAFFTSDREGSQGGADIWTASRDDVGAPFPPPQNLTLLNSTAGERDVVLSSDETELFFASSRRGGVSELWRAVRSCTPS